MSKILDLAAEIEDELNNMHDQNKALMSELNRAKEKNKKIVNMITSFLYDIHEVMNDE